MNHRRRTIAAGLPAVLYVLSLMLPVAGPVMRNSTDTFSGADAFRVAARAFDSDHPSWANDWQWHRIVFAAHWLANPVIWVTVATLAYGFRRLAMVGASVACVLTMSVLPFWWEYVIDYPAYWLWWGSATVALLMAMFVLPHQCTPFAEDYGALTESDGPPFAESCEEVADNLFAEPLTPAVP